MRRSAGRSGRKIGKIERIGTGRTGIGRSGRIMHSTIEIQRPSPVRRHLRRALGVVVAGLVDFIMLYACVVAMVVGEDRRRCVIVHSTIYVL